MRCSTESPTSSPLTTNGSKTTPAASQILEEMAQAIYREWFVSFRFPGHEQVEMVESELGMIPEGWEARRLGELAEENRRSVDPAEIDPDTPYVGLEHIPRRSIALADWGRAEDVQSTKLRFAKKEILFGKIRPYFHKVALAPLSGVCSTDAIVISAKSPEYRALVLCCVSSEPFVAHATQTSQGTNASSELENFGGISRCRSALRLAEPIQRAPRCDHRARRQSCVPEQEPTGHSGSPPRKLVSGEIDVRTPRPRSCRGMNAHHPDAEDALETAAAELFRDARLAGGQCIQRDLPG